MIGRKRTFEEIQAEDQKDTEIPAQPNKKAAQVFSKHYLQIYYDRLFPYQDMFNWLCYFNDPENKSPFIDSKIWRNREFSFTLKDDIYIRYKSYKNMKEWKDDIKRKCPYKIDIGPLYNIEPCRRSTISSDRFMAEEKELVFDIDISDYDDVRTCCSEAGICNKCWPLMCCAIKCLDSALRNDFGLKHLLWVFSGRRGIHCWCSDDVTRKFDVQQRSAIIDYLKLYTGNTMNKIKVDMNIENVKSIHESLNRAYQICLKYFKLCSLEMQCILDTEDGINYFCDMIRDANIQNEVKQLLFKNIDSTDYDHKWMLIQNTFNKYIKSANNNNKKTSSKLMIRGNLMEIVFSYVYPRLDVEVSRHVNHLLKSPFVVHPKTGKVCTIIDPTKCEQFDPDKQPTLNTLIDELNEVGKNNNSKVGWRDTSLKPVVQTFRETFLDNLKKDRIAILKTKQKAEQMF